MIVRLMASLMLSLILTACLTWQSSDSPTATSAPAPSTATSPASPTSTEEIPASPTPTMTVTGVVDAVVTAPALDICLHSWPYITPTIFIMNADGTNVRRVVPEGVVEAWDPAWSPDGSQIAFAGYDGQAGGIFVMDRDGKNVRRVTDGDGSSSEPTWSPDGERIVFVRQHPHPGGTHLYIIDVDGTDMRQLTTFPGSVYGPVWSPDGRRIAYSSDQDGNYEIYVIDADGANLTRLTDRPAWDDEPSWSPDGQRIMFDSAVYGDQAHDIDESEPGIFVVDADGDNLQRVDSFIPGDHETRWSPDGREVAFVHDYEIMIVDTDGGNRRNLTQHPLTDEWLRWSPDGREILFLSNRDLWPPAEPGDGRPEPIILRAGAGEQKGGAGASCAWTGSSFHSIDVLGVWLRPDPLTANAGASIEFDFSGLPELSELEIIAYDFEEAQRIGKLVDNVVAPPCAPPGGTESVCLKQHIDGPALDSTGVYVLELPPGHYAIIVRASFGGGTKRGYTEQGFNLLVAERECLKTRAMSPESGHPDRRLCEVEGSSDHSEGSAGRLDPSTSQSLRSG